MGEELGVGLAAEGVSGGRELGLEGEVVLDDAVVDDGDAVVDVGVGVGVRGASVGGPARVADAGAAVEGFAGDERFEVFELALAAQHVEGAVFEHRHAGR